MTLGCDFAAIAVGGDVGGGVVVVAAGGDVVVVVVAAGGDVGGDVVVVAAGGVLLHARLEKKILDFVTISCEVSRSKKRKKATN